MRQIPVTRLEYPVGDENDKTGHGQQYVCFETADLPIWAEEGERTECEPASQRGEKPPVRVNCGVTCLTATSQIEMASAHADRVNPEKPHAPKPVRGRNDGDDADQCEGPDDGSSVNSVFT